MFFGIISCIQTNTFLSRKGLKNHCLLFTFGISVYDPQYAGYVLHLRGKDTPQNFRPFIFCKTLTATLMSHRERRKEEHPKAFLQLFIRVTKGQGLRHVVFCNFRECFLSSNTLFFISTSLISTPSLRYWENLSTLLSTTVLYLHLVV